jgi:DHA1 family inner membrane transport protein
VSLFACALFLGSSLAVYWTAGLAEDGRYGSIFALSFVVSIVLTATATAGHAAWSAGNPAPAHRHGATPNTA